jgi:hypothetical protein
MANVIKLENGRAEERKLRELLERTHTRLLGVMGCLESLSDSDSDFKAEAAAELAHSVDEIAGDIFAALHSEQTEVANG